jgi:hypothetical protein
LPVCRWCRPLARLTASLGRPHALILGLAVDQTCVERGRVRVKLLAGRLEGAALRTALKLNDAIVAPKLDRNAMETFCALPYDVARRHKRFCITFGDIVCEFSTFPAACS